MISIIFQIRFKNLISQLFYIGKNFFFAIYFLLKNYPRKKLEWFGCYSRSWSGNISRPEISTIFVPNTLIVSPSLRREAIFLKYLEKGCFSTTSPFFLISTLRDFVKNSHSLHLFLMDWSSSAVTGMLNWDALPRSDCAE